VKRLGTIGILFVIVCLGVIHGDAQTDTIQSDITQAIQQHKIITFTYKNHHRVVEPYIYGWNKNTGNNLLSAYQIEGSSESGGLPGWRTFIVTKIKDLVVTDRTFKTPRKDYNPNDSRMSVIFERI